MFLDSYIAFDTLQHRARRWATMTSFVLQTAGLAVLVLIPLWFTAALPPVHDADRLVLPPPARHAFVPPHVAVIPVPTALVDAGLQQPASIPNGIHQAPALDKSPYPGDAAADEEGVDYGPPAIAPDTGADRTWADLLKPAPLSPPPRVADEKPLRLSHLDEGMIIHRVQPQYPLLAKSARIQGQVLLTAVIGKEGDIEQLQAVSGPPLLVRAAMEAVRQWRYRPYLLDGKPCPVETEITVTFRLAQ
jgi:protein TonB